MRTIKFRGYDTADHAREWVTFTLDDLLSGSDDYELIDPDTVAQLVGYDANGNEVYEGDTVIWNDLPMTAKFITNISGGEVLKEDDQ